MAKDSDTSDSAGYTCNLMDESKGKSPDPIEAALQIAKGMVYDFEKQPFADVFEAGMEAESLGLADAATEAERSLEHPPPTDYERALAELRESREGFYAGIQKRLDHLPGPDIHIGSGSDPSDLTADVSPEVSDMPGYTSSVEIT